MPLKELEKDDFEETAFKDQAQAYQGEGVRLRGIPARVRPLHNPHFSPTSSGYLDHDLDKKLQQTIIYHDNQPITHTRSIFVSISPILTITWKRSLMIQQSYMEMKIYPKGLASWSSLDTTYQKWR
nr:unnamed protein product [Callosobruchus analis]